MSVIVDDEWRFWRAQLAGETPETTPGIPHTGYFLLRRRLTFEREHVEVGGPRKRVETHDLPLAIWRENGQWRALIGSDERLDDVDRIDMEFSRACRKPLTYDEWRELMGKNDEDK